MRRRLRWYGASPLHLLALLASFGVAGYAAVELLDVRPVAVGVWFVGAAVLHDLVLFPLYALADRSARGVLRHRAADVDGAPWLNHVRIPALLSGLLLLVWSPLILRLADPSFSFATGTSIDPYLGRWLGISGVLFALSAVVYALRLRPRRDAGTGPDGRPDGQPAAGTSTAGTSTA